MDQVTATFYEPDAAPDMARTAFLFDLDGTLAEIAAHPRDVVLLPRTIDVLDRLFDLTGGAVAIVSGRPIAEVDALVAPLRLPVAGLHGAEWRLPDGRMDRTPIDPVAIGQMGEELVRATVAHPGLFLEAKGAALALHYRQAPDLASAARQAVEAAVARHADAFAVQAGKMVFEIKPRHARKDRAIAAMLDEAPFRGRTPLFAGDDQTDEHGFDLVNRLDGTSIKVGAGPTAARYRLPSTAALLHWLDRAGQARA